MADLEMVERVARALYENHPSDGGWGAILWDEYPTEFRASVYSAARAAIEAMREPTEAMVEAVSAGTGPATHLARKSIYVAMITTALGGDQQ